ncbi:MAG: hypothetical protein Tsb002_36940 [Wenzhouxiangellaceae bacterium]
MTFNTVPCLYKAAQQYAELPQLPRYIDLREVTQADSGALALLLEWQAWANRRQHQFVFIHVPPSLLALAHLMGVSELLEMHQADDLKEPESA